MRLRWNDREMRNWSDVKAVRIFWFRSCRSKNGDLDGAIEDCDKALEIEENRWYYNVRGKCWIAKGKKQIPVKKRSKQYKAYITGVVL